MTPTNCEKLKSEDWTSNKRASPCVCHTVSYYNLSTTITVILSGLTKLGHKQLVQRRYEDHPQGRRQKGDQVGANQLTWGIIHMISGRATDSDSNKAQKKYSCSKCMTVSDAMTPLGPILKFTSQDLEGVSILHNNALVIHTTIANYEVTWVFVDAISVRILAR